MHGSTIAWGCGRAWGWGGVGIMGEENYGGWGDFHLYSVFVCRGLAVGLGTPRVLRYTPLLHIA